jgi:hypothetical protein
VANVLVALEKAPKPVFQRWLEGRKNIPKLKRGKIMEETK